MHHPTPLSGGDRKALGKELSKACAMTAIQADGLLCGSWNERMWANGEPINPSPTVDQAFNGSYPWLEIQCSRCKTRSDVDLAALPHAFTTFVHDLAGRLRCNKCAKAGRRPSATLLQLAHRPRPAPSETR
ncbi:phage FluMu protein Com [Bradyrhizobium japonicum]|nr:phage FluMu protein Com [Bradyrhizobium japonicum]